MDHFALEETFYKSDVSQARSGLFIEVDPYLGSKENTDQ